MMALYGYIDDSGVGDILTLSCLIGDSPAWVFLEFEWKEILAEKNKELIATGRKPISRYHATDCSNSKREFSGWDLHKDQIPFVKELLHAIEKYKFDIVAYTINLKELARLVPSSRTNPDAFAHVMLLHYIMESIRDGTLANHPDAVIGLIHDRGSFDAVLRDAFAAKIDNRSFVAAGRFTSIWPESSERCVPLQQADLIAYENYRESQRDHSQREMRKSLEWILNRGQVGGFLKGFNKAALIDFNNYFENLPEEARNSFLRAARITAS
jgi:hypothetical protein